MYDPEKVFCRPGLHSCGPDYLVTDGQISIFLANDPEELPKGGCMYSFFRIVMDECHCGNYYPLENTDIETDPVELTITIKGKIEVSGMFDAQCLRDALAVAGKDAQLCLGSLPRPFCAPSLLIMPGPKSQECGIRLVRVTALKRSFVHDNAIYEDGIYRVAGCDWLED